MGRPKKISTESGLIESPEVEEVANTGDEFIQKELTKFNIADATIAEWKKQYGSLTISDSNNKEEYEVLNQARTFVKKKRIEVEKVGKGLRTNAIKFQKAVLEEERRIIGLIDPLETYLEGEKERIDNIKLEEKRLRDEKEQIILQERAVKLIQMGMTFTGDAYTMEPDIRISVLSIKTSDQFIFDTLVAGVEKRFKEQELIRLEEERVKEKAAAAAKLLAEQNLAKQEELNKKEAELKAQQDAINTEQARQKAAAEGLIQEQLNAEKKAKEEKLKFRKSSLFQLGFAQQNQRLNFKDLFFLESEINNCSDEEWQEKLRITTENVNITKQKIEEERLLEIEKAKSDAIEKERKRVEAENLTKAKLEQEAKEKAEKEETARLFEEKRIADLAPDSDKLNKFCKIVMDLELPEFSTEAYQKFVEIIKADRTQFLKTLYSKKPQ